MLVHWSGMAPLWSVLVPGVLPCRMLVMDHLTGWTPIRSRPYPRTKSRWTPAPHTDSD